MRNTYLLALLCLVCILSCKKQADTISKAIPATNIAVSSPGFQEYTIKEGAQYCDRTAVLPVNYAELNFLVRFDSSAIYTNSDPANQYDINKLYGFSDNNADHHQFSARFGWRWSDGALRLFAYTYNFGTRDSRELGTIAIGSENQCSIRVMEHKYIFTLNGLVDSLDRGSSTPLGTGYKLYPYFGGDETAPHDIHIWIRDLP